MPRFSSLLSAYVFVVVEVAGIYQIPLSDHYPPIPQKEQHSTRNNQPHQQVRSPQGQQHIFTQPNTHHDPHPNIPLRDTALILYSLPISLGTPSQYFPVALSLSPTPLFLPSASCWSVYCKSRRDQDISSKIPQYSSSSSEETSQLPPFYTYNSTLSSTTHPTNLTSSYQFANVLFAGKITLDTLTLGPITIHSQPFISAERVEPTTFFHWYFEYSGVLGLGYPSSSSPLIEENENLPPPWKLLVDQTLLPKNLFTIVLPSGPRDLSKPRTNGLLTFGDIPLQHAMKKFTYLPLHPHTPKSWTVSVTSLSFGDENGGNDFKGALHQDFTATPGGAKTSFETTTPFILLPGTWAPSLKRLIGVTEPDGVFWEFACEKRDDLPDLVFRFLVHQHDEDELSEIRRDNRFKEEKEIRLSPYEYTFEVTGGNVPNLPPIGCRIGFEESKEGEIVLGWPFLQNFVAVFDFDRGRVGLARLGDEKAS